MTLAQAMAQFAVVAGLLTLTPGIDTALVLRQALTTTRRHAMLTAVGIGAGCLVWGVAAAVGISALVTASRLGFDAVRLAGALYLLWMGLQMLRTACRGGDPLHAATNAVAPASPGRSFRRGLLTNLLNPKIGVFYVAVLPQFLPPGHDPALVGVALAGIHVAEGLAWFTVLVLAAHAMRRWLDRPATQRLIDAVTGTVLVGFAAHLVDSTLRG